MIYIVDLEAVETRYTAQWKSHVPKIIQGQGHQVQVISGLKIFLVPLLLVPFLTLAGLISISLAKLKRSLAFLPPEPLWPATILFFMMLGIQVLST